MSPSPVNIHISHSSTGYSFSPSWSKVDVGGMVSFTGAPGNLRTIVTSSSSPAAFGSGLLPYTVPNTYKLAPGISGDVTISCEETLLSTGSNAGICTTGTTGTINVGSGDRPRSYFYSHSHSHGEGGDESDNK
jgi:hypothetical protein